MSKKTTIVKKSKTQICSISLNDLEGKRTKFDYISDENLISAEVFRDIVLFSPSKQSHLGVKLSHRIEKHIDELVKELLKDLDIKHKYFFSSYSSKSGKLDLSEKIKNENNTFIALYCPDSFLESLYASVRNALAHGNIAKKGKSYYLYSVSSKNSDKCNEKEKQLSFLLKTNNFNNLDSYINVFKKFN